MECFAMIGGEYGMSFNLDKLEILAVRTYHEVYDCMGRAIRKKGKLKYLGSILTDDGRITSELGQRLGLARMDFDGLQACWKNIH
eukprot:11748291-Karenia_brevis.AAC.1